MGACEGSRIQRPGVEFGFPYYPRAIDRTLLASHRPRGSPLQSHFGTVSHHGGPSLSPPLRLAPFSRLYAKARPPRGCRPARKHCHRSSFCPGRPLRPTLVCQGRASHCFRRCPPQDRGAAPRSRKRCSRRQQASRSARYAARSAQPRPALGRCLPPSPRGCCGAGCADAEADGQGHARPDRLRRRGGEGARDLPHAAVAALLRERRAREAG
mmetsp:Transcript_32931/g.77602  ORF Transcript_32931/g.77602 Transcript_32931/m.77602 type:complete len:212 (+) Transcript_32931:495-1130(+)